MISFFRKIIRLLVALKFRLLVPHGLSVRLIHKGFSMPVYKVSAGACVDSDVASRTLTATANGEVLKTGVFPALTTDFGVIELPEGTHAVVSLFDTDTSGNTSQVASIDFDVKDSIPPVQPTGLAVEQVAA